MVASRFVQSNLSGSWSQKQRGYAGLSGLYIGLVRHFAADVPKGVKQIKDDWQPLKPLLAGSTALLLVMRFSLGTKW